MTVWTVFERGDADEAHIPPDWAESLVFVPERMSRSAVLLAPLVLLRHRLWLGLLGYVLVQGLVLAAIRLLGLESNAYLLLLVANIGVAVGLPDLRHAKLRAGGYEEAGAVVARGLESAEQRYLDARLAGGRVPASPILNVRAQGLHAPASVAQNSSPGRPVEARVLGLFPEAGR